jgi:hypothetical protein
MRHALPHTYPAQNQDTLTVCHQSERDHQGETRLTGTADRKLAESGSNEGAKVGQPEAAAASHPYQQARPHGFVPRARRGSPGRRGPAETLICTTTVWSGSGDRLGVCAVCGDVDVAALLVMDAAGAPYDRPGLRPGGASCHARPVASCHGTSQSCVAQGHVAEGGRRAPWRAQNQRPAHFGQDIALRVTSQAQATAAAHGAPIQGSCGNINSTVG